MSKLSTQELFGKYCTKKEHSLQVEKLCSLIFDEVNKKVKELPETQKQILKASALLHDIGYFKTSGKEHNKYSFQRENISGIKGSFLEKYLKVLETMNIPIYDITPYVLEDKSEEIKTYLRNNPLITDFVIIDDELVSIDLRKYQVYLDLYKGLEEEHIKPILDILSGKRGFYPENYNQLETNEQRLKRINRYYNLR